MLTLGLDLSLTATGWCVVQWAPGHWRPLESGVVKPPDRLRGGERLWRIWTEIREHIPEPDPGNPVRVALEGPSYASLAQGHQLGELHGVVKVFLHRRGLEPAIYPPGTWRKATLGKGNLAKDAVRVEILKRWGVEFPDMNTVEAFGVAACDYLGQSGDPMPSIPVERRGRTA